MFPTPGASAWPPPRRPSPACRRNAEDKLIDGFGFDQILDGGYLPGPDILAGTRDLLAFGLPEPEAVRVDDGRLFVDTRAVRAVERYASAQPDALFNLALDDVDHHGNWLLTAALWLAGLGALAAFGRRANGIQA